ncbi:sensor histidine kinase [Chryseobacterium profundimaris]|uniref:histidine kinase n=1 Tax=Chryseobacterium profundimaris TaxID=1387275 RepID=A0ABY1NYZ1_9FLAO|nr:HAMP domain-containing sensor histidine kinase [Chryseobacterium profundimaris]SMP21476.1 Signal transduction histidine kinase [Chryseobacterium profundimaris]
MKYLRVLLLVLSIARISAQQENYYEKWYSADESKLPQNTIKSIVKDKYGFMWLSTENGIVRFDGKNFITYDIHLPSVENRPLMIDGSADDDWLFTFYNSGEIPSLITKRGFSVISDKNSSHFKQLKTHGAENLWKILKEDSDKAQRVRYYFYISKKEFYYLDNYRLFYQKDGKGRFIRDLNGYSYFRFFLLGDELFYLKDSSLIEKIEKTGEIIESQTGITKKDDIDFFINNANKQFLIRNDDKIYLIENKNNIISSTLICSSKTLKDLSITCLYYDYMTKTLIVGTLSKGFLLIRKNFINAYNTPKRTTFHAVTAFSDNKVITAEGDVFNANGYVSSLPFSNKDKYGILPLHGQEGFILKSEHGIILWSQGKSKTIRNFGKNTVVRCISSTAGNKIWISLASDKDLIGYIIMKDQKIIKEKFYTINAPVRGITQVNSEEFLLAAHNGLYLFNEKKSTRKTLVKDITFRSINNNADDLFWAQTYGKGLYLYTNGRLYEPPQKNSVLSSVHSVIDDGIGYYWLSSNKGLFQVKKQNFINSYLQGDHGVYIHKYSRKDGLRTSEFNGGANINGLINDGFIIFPSMNGIVYIDTRNAFPAMPGKDYYLDRIAVNEKEKKISGILNLENNFGYVKIFVDYINLGNPGNDYIEYKIDDNRWQPLPDDRMIGINSLTNGKHEVKVRKLEDFSSDYHYKTLELFVKPAFWETAWFKLFAVIVLLLVFYLFYRIRLKQIEKESLILNAKIEERTRELKESVNSLSKTREELYAQLYRQKKLVAAISHDIKSPLKFINMSTEILMDSIDDTCYEKKVISSIKESSAQILDFIDSTINYNKIFIYDNYKTRENIMLRDFIFQRMRLFTNTAEFKFIQIQNNIGKNDVVVSNPDVLSIVIHNILDNAIKYTDQGFIYIYGITKECRYHLVIEDTGLGMSEEELAIMKKTQDFSGSRLGMKIVKELLPLIDVSFDIESKKGEGTKMILTFAV